MSSSIEKLSNSEYFRLINKTKQRIKDAEKKSDGDYEKFKALMITRMNRITHQEKLEIAIRQLKRCGYDELAKIYECKIVLNNLL